MRKRIMSLVLVLVMVFALMPTLSTQANAQTGGHTQAEAVAWAQSQNGASLDYDGVYGAQCVDLIKYYYAYLGGNAGYAVGNANQYASNALPSGWTRVYSNYQPGDIAVFKVNHSSYNENGSLVVSTGELGHVSIITSVSGSWFYSMNQNFNNHSYVESKNFPVDAIQCAIRPDFATGNPHYYFTENSCELMSNTSVKPKTKITAENTSISALTSAGIIIYDNHNNEIGRVEETDIANQYSYMNLWYTVGAGQEINMTLNPGTSYKYKFFVRAGSSTYVDEVRSFKTGGSGVCLNVDGLLSGASSSTTGSCGTFDVYIRGTLVANDVNEYNVPEHYGSAYEIKDIKAKDGYTYKGVASGSLTGNIYGSTVNVVLKFDKAASEVTLDPNGGSVSPTTITAASGGTYGTLPTPTRSGYQFKGWYTSANGGSAVTSNTTVLDDVTVLYAHWSKLYAVNGGNLVIGLNDLSSGEATVDGCDSTVTDAVVPSSVDGKPVTQVNAGAFKNLTNLRTLVLPNTITKILKDNFIGCTALKAVYIPASVSRMMASTDLNYSDLTMDVYFGGSESLWNSIWYKTRLLISTVECDPFNGTGNQIKVHFNCPDPQDFAITQQPQSVTAQAGNTVLLSVSAAGNGMNYRWQTAPAGSSTWTDCGSDNMLQINATSARNGERYRCIVTDAFGNSATSSTATLTVNGSIDTNPFTDVAKGKFYYEPVLWAISQNPQITTGVTNTTFEPDRTCTRAHVVTFLWRANGCPNPSNMTSNFKDVKDTSKYYYKAVLWAAEQGITTGYSDGTFRPDDECTRGQVVTFLWRAKGQPTPSSGSIPFTDVPSGKYFTNAVLWALQNNITQGRTATTFGPDDACTRGHVVTFLYRAYH